MTSPVVLLWGRLTAHNTCKLAKVIQCNHRLLQEGKEFEPAADNYVREFLNKGVPSLFSDLKPLYK